MRNRWDQLNKFYWSNQGLVHGAIIYAILVVLVFIILVWILEIPEASVTGAGQFFADWLLFPIVIIGFYFAIKEFRKSQVLPKLEIFITGDAGVIVDGTTFILRSSDTYDTSYSLLAHVNNEGELVTPWYRIAIDLPTNVFHITEVVEVDARGHKKGIYELRWHLGNEENWGDNLNSQRRQYEFKSNGLQALYPGQTVHIATLKVEIPKIHIQKPRQGVINYSIVTDKTKIVHKEQAVIIRKEDRRPARH